MNKLKNKIKNKLFVYFKIKLKYIFLIFKINSKVSMIMSQFKKYEIIFNENFTFKLSYDNN